MTTSAAQLAIITCPDHETAIKIARHLVNERLAAGANIVPGLTSVYRWQNEIHEDSECLIMAQTTAERFAALQTAVVALHPYELPECISVRIDAGLAPYLEWITNNT